MSSELDLSGVPPAPAAAIRAGREAERAGQPEQARACYEAALRALRGSQHAPLAASLYRWIAWTYTNTGDSEAALDCLEVAEAASEAAGDERGLASALNTRAGTLFNLGELDQADALFRRVRGLAWRIGDRKLQAMADQNLGSVASIRGDLKVALGRFRSSLMEYEALGLTQYVGPILNNIGRLQIELGEDKDAAGTLARARALCVDRGDRHHRIVVEVNHARLLLRGGQVAQAHRACEEARACMDATGDDRWKAEVHLLTGAVHARLGQPGLALEALEIAAQVARERRDVKVLADIVLEQAGVLRELGRNRDTLLRLNEAHGIFRRLRARRELADVDTRLATLESVFLQITRGWGESIESKDAYTQGHCSRVADIACLLATAADFPADEMNWFRMGALLHDVGKVAVREGVLNKPGPLDDDEWKEMARHPLAGVELLEGVEFPWDVKPMIRHHHEKWDGNGYPHKLAGEAIPFAARILTIADVYDALTTDRPYRPGFSHDQALSIMEGDAGRTLDPSLHLVFRHRVAPHLRTSRSAAVAPAVSAAAGSPSRRVPQWRPSAAAAAVAGAMAVPA